MKILVVGSTAYDLLLSYDGSFPDAIDPSGLNNLSVAYVTPHLAKHFGGTGANIAWNLRLLGRHPLLVSSVGDDGAPYIDLLKQSGVEVSLIERIEGAMTSTAIVGTDDHEHQITFYHPGADAKGSWPDLSKERKHITYAIVAPRDETVMVRALEWCEHSKIPVLFDPGQRISNFSDDDLRRSLKRSTGLIANEYEWGLISKRLSITPEETLEFTAMIIVTKGEEGAVAYTREGILKVRACIPNHVINPTGAGDAFRAGLLTGLQAEWSLLHSLRLASAMGSFAVETEGTLMEELKLSEVRERVLKTYDEEDLPSLGRLE